MGGNWFDQFFGAEAGHFAKGRIDVNDLAFEVAGAHADGQ
jgi:hypothetical protein